MRRTRGARDWLVGSAILISMLLLKPVQDHIDASAGTRPLDPDLLFFTAPTAVQKLALGYDSLLADVYWMRAIQYYGRREEAARRPVRYGNLATLLDVTTTLDPDMMDVYHFGSSFLSEPDPVGAGQPLEAIRLLDKGVARHPENWKLRYDKGFVYYWYLNDYRSAAGVWLEAGRLSAAPRWLEALAAVALSRSGAIDTARTLWMRQYQESTRADMKENARNHLFSLQVDEDLWTLEYLISKYKQRFGPPPPSLEELVRMGWLRAIPADPSGVPYSYNAAVGAVNLDPRSAVRRLKIPYDYSVAFREKLDREFAGR